MTNLLDKAKQGQVWYAPNENALFVIEAVGFAPPGIFVPRSFDEPRVFVDYGARNTLRSFSLDNLAHLHLVYIGELW